jgi:hypothetical protein
MDQGVPLGDAWLGEESGVGFGRLVIELGPFHLYGTPGVVIRDLTPFRFSL